MIVALIDRRTNTVTLREELPEAEARVRYSMLVPHCDLQARDFGEDLVAYIGEDEPVLPGGEE